MQVTVEVAGGETGEVDLEEGATYADLLRAAGFRPGRATVLVEGRPVPNDQSVEHESVTVLRLIEGG